MSDPIQEAITSANRAANSAQNAASDAANTAQDAVNDAVGSAVSFAEDSYNDSLTQFNDIKNSLPVEPDLELLQRKAEARVLEEKAKIEELLDVSKDDAIEMLKELLSGLSLPSLKFPPKLPVLDPKILQAVEIAKQIKELYKLKQTLSRESLLKGATTFEYPVSKVKIVDPREQLSSLRENLPEPPEIPDLPFKQ